MKLTSKIHDEYDQVRTLPDALVKQQKQAAATRAKQLKAGKKTTATTIEEHGVDEDTDMTTPVQQLIDTLPPKSTL
jgi:pleiotropic regulator 1